MAPQVCIDDLDCPPLAFTEHGILMLSSVMRSKRAIEINIAIVRIFNHMREILDEHKELKHVVYENQEEIRNIWFELEKLSMDDNDINERLI